MPAPLDFPPNAAHPAAPVGGDKWPSPAVPNQPIYTYDGEKWTTGDPNAGGIGASTTLPLMDGTATAGVEVDWARGDHVHPTDTTRAPITSPTFLVDAKAPTPPPASNDTNVATTAFVNTAIAAWPTGQSQPIPPSNIFPIGTLALLTLKTGQTVAANATTSGVNLSQPIWMGDAAVGYVVQGGISGPQQTGTWKNMSGLTIGTGSTAGTGNFVGYFVRTA